MYNDYKSYKKVYLHGTFRHQVYAVQTRQCQGCKLATLSSFQYPRQENLEKKGIEMVYLCVAKVCCEEVKFF